MLDYVVMLTKDAIPGWRLYGATSKDRWRTILRSSTNGQTAWSLDNTAIDASNPVPERTHIFEIVGFERGGI
jgi:hypothetical protein